MLNVGTGTDLTIGELAGIVREVVGYRGELRFDTTKPDGTASFWTRMQALHLLSSVFRPRSPSSLPPIAMVASISP